MYVMRWWTLTGLNMSVKYTKWPSALAYDEMNYEMVKWHSRNNMWVTMKYKGANDKECGDNMTWD